jgi:hypothetical protein
MNTIKKLKTERKANYWFFLPVSLDGPRREMLDSYVLVYARRVLGMLNIPTVKDGLSN